MQDKLLYGLLVLYSLSFFSYSFYATVIRRSWLWNTSRLLFSAGFVVHLVYLIQRSIATGRAPWGNQFEVMLLFAFVIAVAYLGFEWFSKSRSFGPFASLVIFLVCSYSLFFLDSTISPLVPALQSYWLWIHVAVTVISYGTFTIAFFAAFQYLLKQSFKHRYLATVAASWCIGFVSLILVFHQQGILKPYTESFGPFLLLLLYTVGLAFLISIPLYGFFALIKIQRYFADDATLEKWTYRWVSLGFPLLALGIMMGALWAAEAWGSWWSNDSKEWWALITWLIYAVYLHLHLISKWRGVRSAWVACLGFLSVIFTFFGVNYLLAGLHSYA